MACIQESADFLMVVSLSAWKDLPSNIMIAALLILIILVRLLSKPT